MTATRCVCRTGRELFAARIAGAAAPAAVNHIDIERDIQGTDIAAAIPVAVSPGTIE